MSRDSVIKAEINERLRTLVDEAILNSGTSARAVSLAVSGHDGLVRDIRAGNVPTADKVAALCKHLNIPFSIGADYKVGFDPLAIREQLPTIEIEEPFEIVGNHSVLPERSAYVLRPLFDRPGIFDAGRFYLVEPLVSPKPMELAVIRRADGDRMVVRFLELNEDGMIRVETRYDDVRELELTGIAEINPVTWSGWTQPISATSTPEILGPSVKSERHQQIKDIIRGLRDDAERNGRPIGPYEMLDQAVNMVRDLEEASENSE